MGKAPRIQRYDAAGLGQGNLPRVLRDAVPHPRGRPRGRQSLADSMIAQISLEKYFTLTFWLSNPQNPDNSLRAEAPWPFGATPIRQFLVGTVQRTAPRGGLSR